MGERNEPGRAGERELSLDDDLRGTGSAGWEELELEPVAGERPPRASAPSGVRTDAAPAPDKPEKSAPARTSAAPAEATPAPAPPPAEVAAIADYGAAPKGFLGAVPYAVLVVS